MKDRKRLGDMLVARGVISEFQLSAALNDQRRWGNRLGTSLIRLGFLDEETLTEFLASQYGLPGVNLRKVVPEPRALRTLSPEVALERLVLPLALRKGEGGKETLEIAFGDPRDLERLDEIRFVTNHPLQIRMASDHAIHRAINKYYFNREEAPRAADSISLGADTGDNRMVVVRSLDDDLGAQPAPAHARKPTPAPGDARPSGTRHTGPDGADEAPRSARPRHAEGDPAEEALHAMRALARLLVRKRIITSEELRAELRKK